jgi:L-seryl-tRNA(Ser) seleniumtransferase
VQCGIIAGRKDLIAKIRKNSLKRALRVDKMTIAAMETILRLYLYPERLAQTLPTLRIITRSEAAIRAQAERLAPLVAAALSGVAVVTVVPCSSQIGSGALPMESLPRAALALTPPVPGGEGRWLIALAERLRALPVPIIGRISTGAFLLDLRTLEDEALFVQQISSLTFDTAICP